MSYVEFYEVYGHGRKTRIVDVVASKGDYTLLGRISFWSAWRQYTFQPEGDTVFDVKCLNEVTEKIDEMNKERRKKKVSE